MCGLFGFVKIGADRLSENEIIAGDKALLTLAHRGPDQHNKAIEGNIYMGHRRLSILDLSEAGRQPMSAHNLVLTANGEIYNYQELRREIGEEKFQSGSDSEVLLHGYNAMGADKLIEKIDGMYAFVLLDKSNGNLYFVRDRSGIKPLIYARLGDYFIWASELKAIRNFALTLNISLNTDNTALFDFLTYRYIPAEKTIYKEAYNLLPAHTLCLNSKSGDIAIRRYWSLPVSDAPVNHDHAAERLRDVLGRAVNQHMVADVPVGFFLSGGMDSSIMVALAADLRKDLATFTIGYDHKAHDETQYASIVAQQFKTQHHEKILSQSDSCNLPELIMDWYDQPFGDNSALPTYHVSAFARQHAIVALSGDGGDELFGGYRWYERMMRYSGIKIPFSQPSFIQYNKGGIINRLLSRLDLMTQSDPLALYSMLVDGLPPQFTKQFRNDLEIPKDYDPLWLFRKFDKPELSPRKRLQYIDFHTFLPDDILTKVDRVSMRVALETRVPFLAREVIETAFSLPEDFIYKNNTLKGGLKFAFKDDLPDSILNRDKKGFSIPAHIWSKAGYDKFQLSVYRHFINSQKAAQ